MKHLLFFCFWTSQSFWWARRGFWRIFNWELLWSSLPSLARCWTARSWTRTSLAFSHQSSRTTSSALFASRSEGKSRGISFVVDLLRGYKLQITNLRFAATFRDNICTRITSQGFRNSIWVFSKLFYFILSSLFPCIRCWSILDNWELNKCS